MELSQLTNKAQIFDKILIGKFDTRKKLNRSTKKICKEFINNLEEQEVTSEAIKNLSKTYPIFIYQSCITIHGTTDTTTERIGDYKNVILNKNGSLEIRYNAIDLTKKRFLAEVCTGWKFNRNSSENYLYKTIAYTTDKAEAQRLYNEAKEIWLNKKINGVKAQIYFNAYNFYGKILIELVFKPLLIEGDIKEIASEIEGTTIQGIEEIIKNIAEEKKAYQKECDEATAKRQAKEKATDTAKNDFKSKLNNLQSITIFEPNKIYIEARAYNGKAYFLFIQTGEKKGFGMMSFKSGKSTNLNLPELLESKEKIKAKGDNLGRYLPRNFKIYK